MQEERVPLYRKEEWDCKLKCGDDADLYELGNLLTYLHQRVGVPTKILTEVVLKARRSRVKDFVELYTDFKSKAQRMDRLKERNRPEIIVIDDEDIFKDMPPLMK